MFDEDDILDFEFIDDLDTYNQNGILQSFPLSVVDTFLSFLLYRIRSSD